MKNITIIGGTSGLGLWIAKYLLSHFKYNITLIGRDIVKGKRISSELGCMFETSFEHGLQKSDITVVSVPISVMEQTIENIAPFLKKNSVLIDVCSVKGFVVDAMKKHIDSSIIVIPTHPMFGPYISSIAGQVFVLTPEKNVSTHPVYGGIKKYLKEKSAVVIESNSENHDKMMAIVQGLTHYNMFIYGETIKQLSIDIGESMRFISPVYKIMISSVSRYMNQDMNLYYDIQVYNTYNREVHQKFMEVSDEFNTLIRDKNKNQFLDKLEQTKKYFGENADKGQKYTDKIIYMISHQLEILHNKIGKEVELKNIQTGEKIIKTLLKVEKENIYLEGGEVVNLDTYFVM